MDTLTVPFEIANINHGFQKASGLLKLEEGHLVMEYQVEDAIVGMFKSDVKEVSLPISELLEVEFKKRFFSAKLILRGQSMKVFQDVPGTEQARCELKIKRGERDMAARLASRLQLALSEYRLDQMDNS